VVHPASFDLAKLLWIPDGVATPAPAEQDLHFVHTVFDEAVQAFDVYDPAAHTAHFVHTVFDEAVHALAM